jgi:hypothetical protein
MYFCADFPIFFLIFYNSLYQVEQTVDELSNELISVKEMSVFLTNPHFILILSLIYNALY